MPNQHYQKWKPYHLNWVKENISLYKTYKELMIAFNKHFNEQATKWAIIGMLRRVFGTANISDNHIYTKKEDDWLKENYPNSYINSYQLVDKFNKQFNTNLTAINLKAHCNKTLHLQKNYDSYTYIVGGSDEVPLGSEYIDGKYTYIKINNIRKKGQRCFRENWKLKHRYIWEQTYGPIPKGYCILFLDGNTLNCDINNLYLVTKKEVLHLQTLGWLGQGEITIAGIEVLRSEQALVDAGIIKRSVDNDLDRLREYHKRKKVINNA